MNLKTITKLVAVMMLSAAASSQATTLGAANLLGKIVPGTPADPANEVKMVNFLVTHYNAGHSGNLGDNPADPQTEVYYLTPGANVPAKPLPTATITGSTGAVTSNTTINLGSGWEYLLAKFGQDSEVLWVGGLTGQYTIGNVTGNHNGLSHWQLFDPKTTRVPDGGATIALLGVGLLGLGAIRRKLS